MLATNTRGELDSTSINYLPEFLLFHPGLKRSKASREHLLLLVEARFTVRGQLAGAGSG